MGNLLAMTNNKLKLDIKVKSLEKISDGIARAKARILYSRDEPVIGTRGEKVYIDDEFCVQLSKRFNKDHKGILGFAKRYPQLIMEHRKEDIGEVVGRLDSKIRETKEEIDGKIRTCLYCDVLITAPDIINKIENDEINGVSSGIYFDKKGQYLKELTVTKEPVLSKAVLLSKTSEKMILSQSQIADMIIELEDEITRLEEAKEKEIERNLELSNLKKRENERFELVRDVLLDQVRKNKLSRKDADYLYHECKDEVSPQTFNKIFSKVVPLKKHTTVTLDPNKIIGKK